MIILDIIESPDMTWWKSEDIITFQNDDLSRGQRCFLGLFFLILVGKKTVWKPKNYTKKKLNKERIREELW